MEHIRQIPAWTLGDRISKARRAAGIGQADLAARLSVPKHQVNQSLISKWERDEREPRVSTLRRLAEATGADEEWLLNGRGTLNS